MTNTPGDGQPPQDPSDGPPEGADTPPYGQPSEQPTAPYGQPPQYGQAGPPQYGQPGPPAYGQPQYAPQPGYPVAYAPDHPRATTALVLGILGVVLCQLVAPFAWVIGRRTVAEIDGSNGQLGGRGSAQAGYVLGIVGTVLLGLALLAVIAWIVLVALAFSSSNSTY
jgi:hypothetical protein